MQQRELQYVLYKRVLERIVIIDVSSIFLDSWSSLTCTAGGTLTSQLKVRTHSSVICLFVLTQVHTHIKVYSLYCSFNDSLYTKSTVYVRSL